MTFAIHILAVAIGSALGAAAGVIVMRIANYVYTNNRWPWQKTIPTDSPKAQALFEALEQLDPASGGKMSSYDAFRPMINAWASQAKLASQSVNQSNGPPLPKAPIDPATVQKWHDLAAQIEQRQQEMTRNFEQEFYGKGPEE